MKASYSVKWILTGALLMPGLTACSFFGGGEEQAAEVAAEGEDSEAADPADAEAVAGAETSETVGTDETIANGAAESMNTSTTDLGVPGAETGVPSDIPPELLGGNPAAETGMPPPSLDAGAEMPAPVAAPMTPSGDMRVYYVNASGVAVKDRPAADGASVGSLSLGDPVLEDREGNWANVLNRGWVELSSLSMGPVARNKTPKSWN